MNNQLICNHLQIKLGFYISCLPILHMSFQIFNLAFFTRTLFWHTYYRNFNHFQFLLFGFHQLLHNTNFVCTKSICPFRKFCGKGWPKFPWLCNKWMFFKFWLTYCVELLAFNLHILIHIFNSNFSALFSSFFLGYV